MYDIDYYKLTMLQFIWKHHAEIPVQWTLHSRNRDLTDILDVGKQATDWFVTRPMNGLSYNELVWLRNQQVFEDAFIGDLDRLLRGGMAEVEVHPDSITVGGTWFNTTLWETIVLARISREYSIRHVEFPRSDKLEHDLDRIEAVGAKWADFGTRRRYGSDWHEFAIREATKRKGFVGTSNVGFARALGLQPIGTYAHELEMVLCNELGGHIAATREVLRRWREMYPKHLRIALTDTYGTKSFLENHGDVLLSNDWRGVRLDSGNPFEMGYLVNGWLAENNYRSQERTTWDVVFSDGLDADTIIDLHKEFSGSRINPVFGWGTKFTNPNSDLSLVMKATHACGNPTYKTTDSPDKAIR